MALRIVYSLSYSHIGMIPSSDQRMEFTLGFHHWVLDFNIARILQNIATPCHRRARVGAAHCVFSVVYPYTNIVTLLWHRFPIRE